MLVYSNSSYQSIPAGSAALLTGNVMDNGTPRANHTMVITTLGTATAGNVQLQGSLDGVNWFIMAAPVAVALTGASVTPVSYPLAAATGLAQFVRAVITTAVTGTTIGVMVASS